MSICSCELKWCIPRTISKQMGLFTALLVLGFGLGAGAQGQNYKWRLPEGFPPPPVPADNPMSAAKVELGRYLFYDRRMSGNGTQACASCHIQRLAFTDGRSHAVGSTGQLHSRSSMSLVNVAYSKTLTWSNPNLTTLEDQMRVPMFGINPVELGLTEDGAAFLKIIKSDKQYQRLFQRAFPKYPDAFTMTNVIRSIACFERTIISAGSDWDADWRQLLHFYELKRDASKTSEAARRGEFLFFSDKLSCGRCHGGANFNDTYSSENVLQAEASFHNNGMPPMAPGLMEFTGARDDSGKFKPPTMRNIELTAPYMHDGSLPTLEAVIDHYATGGSHGPTQSPLVHGFEISQQERADLIAFLRSLTDFQVIRDPKLSNPWQQEKRPHQIGRGGPSPAKR
jgi:cytochrome c peroxidase